MRSLVHKLGVDDSVFFLGPIADDEKAKIYRRSSCFILPSSENFGVVIAEAMSHELPVIATTGTPWKDA